ncbi:MAG: uroporphyrinogen decarboxylase, partial [Candidatus Hydrogenedentes bacterium]|nr:uroporphyrinogen decarboxylase [Candidatus Hydrogenedentota bacterium]
GLRFARAQVEAGVDLIGVGDAAASLVGPDLYETCVWPFEKRLVDGIHAMGAHVRLHICGNTHAILANMGRLGCDIVDLDYMVPLDEARTAMGPAQVLLGNRDAVAACHRAAGSRYIVGAGCEIVRDTPPDRLLILRDYARTHV